MEEKEVETHLKLRKHFDHKFNSKVKINYADKKEKVDQY